MSAPEKKDRAKRRTHDAYDTPTKYITPLLSFIDFRRSPTFGEPCAGRGNILNAVAPFVAPDPVWAEIKSGRDYMAIPFDVDLIITNPPYLMAETFLRKSLKEADTVIYLLRLNFLGSQKRREFFRHYEPSHLFVLSERPSFTGGGTDSTEYAWFVWDRRARITVPPGIYHL